MTIAVTVKVNDGVVLASDSASTLIQADDKGSTFITNVYNHANKIVNLHKSLPIGIMTWGAGAIGQSSMSTLFKDLRQRLTGTDKAFQDWKLDKDSYSVKAVADFVHRFIYEDLYRPTFDSWAKKPFLGMLVAGYSVNSPMAEEYLITIDEEGKCAAPTLIRGKEECGAAWYGEPLAISRLVSGYDPRLLQVLQTKLGVDSPQAEYAVTTIDEEFRIPVIQDPMPIQDAIDLATFFVELTKQYSRFTPGAATVGGPVEIAAITKHEGFQWVNRKLYFTSEFNPENNYGRQ